MKEHAILQTIENDRKITMESDRDFLFEYQKAMLLALKEHGTLDDVQYKYAEQLLKEQFRTFEKKKLLCNTKTGGDGK